MVPLTDCTVLIASPTGRCPQAPRYCRRDCIRAVVGAASSPKYEKENEFILAEHRYIQTRYLPNAVLVCVILLRAPGIA